MSAFVAPVDVPEPAPGAFGRCECSHAIYDHGRVNMDGNQVWVGCKHCDDCLTFRAADGSRWPNVSTGAVPEEPTDLDRNSEAWVDGQVLLEHEREPDIGGRA